MFCVLAFSRRCNFFLNFAFQSFGLDVETQPVINAHVLVCHPHQREPRDQISAPVGKQYLELRDEHEGGGDVMAEAILAGEEIEEFSLIPTPAILTAPLAVLTRFAKDLFVRNRPGDARNRNRQQKKLDDLKTQSRHFVGIPARRDQRSLTLGIFGRGRRI